YTNSREDFAMLFEELMMQLRHGVKRDTAVADKESPYYIAWGQRGRISDIAVKSRAQLVFSKIRPDLDTEIQIAFLEPVTELQAGSAWFDTIEQEAQKIQAFSRSTTTSEQISEPVIGHPHPLNVPE
ncbi:MAG: hypothetical protein MI864_12150, partial [Pseudomonadales bacterium]|nr:hypothetical protein [Pseudomonadales bacterium]